jgi:hypothetical protein
MLFFLNPLSSLISLASRSMIAIVSLVMSLSIAANAAVIVTFSPDADNLANTVVTVSGSGSTNNQSQWLNGLGTGYYDLGNPFKSNLSDTDFYLTEDLFYIANQRIVFLRLDDDGLPENDDFAIYTNMSIPTNTSYSLSGSARVPGLQFAWLNVGTYTTQRQPIGNADSSFAVGGFTLVVSNDPVRVGNQTVPEPTSMAIFGIGALGIAYRAGRRK